MRTILLKDNETVLDTFLRYAGVKYTQKYATTLFHEHPYKYTLWGLSQMLSVYQIENVGLQIEKKQEIREEFPAPYIAHIGNDFVTVYKQTKDHVYYVWNGKDIVNSVEEFNNIWSGVVLLAEVTEKSQEPDYEVNRKNEIIDTGKNWLYGFSFLFLISVYLFYTRLYLDWGWVLNVVLNFAGLFIGSLLLMKQLNIYTAYTDKFCSVFKEKDCNDVLSSPAARLMGIFSWSEIGFCYFLTNLIILFICPECVFKLAFVNVFTLPFTVWSIWYQKVKVKNWCTLCLITQVLLWTLFVVNVFNGIEFVSPATILIFFILLITYILVYLFISFIVELLTEKRANNNIRHEMNSLKMNESVFKALLEKQPYYAIDESISSIVLGNPTAKNKITVVTNPHCEPCAHMHKRVEKLLQQTRECCVTYIFAGFQEKYSLSSNYLIYSYFNHTEEGVRQKYNDWFKSEKYRYEELYKTHADTLHLEEVEKELLLHTEWIKKNRIHSTPTLLVNGFVLPVNYKVEDLIHIF